MSLFKYKKIGLGGTFDHFHKGHQSFLLFASQLAEHLVIGITTPEMISHKKFSSQIQEYEVRAEAVKSFTKNFFNKVDVIPLTDPYGPTLIGSNVEALAATTATKSGAEAVNAKRLEIGLTKLPIHTCELENDENGSPLASERIRSGAVNGSGKVYENVLKNDIKISDKHIQFFTKVQGPVVKHPSPGDYYYVVGDTSLETFIKNNWPYHLGVIDFLKQRKTYSPLVLSKERIINTVTNPPGSISAEMSKSLQKALTEKQKHVVITGEEDLAAVALVLLAPLGAHIYYGQPKVGLIEMIANEEKKEAVFKLLSET